MNAAGKNDGGEELDDVAGDHVDDGGMAAVMLVANGSDIQLGV